MFVGVSRLLVSMGKCAGSCPLCCGDSPLPGHVCPWLQPEAMTRLAGVRPSSAERAQDVARLGLAFPLGTGRQWDNAWWRV